MTWGSHTGRAQHGECSSGKQMMRTCGHNGKTRPSLATQEHAHNENTTTYLLDSVKLHNCVFRCDRCAAVCAGPLTGDTNCVSGGNARYRLFQGTALAVRL